MLNVVYIIILGLIHHSGVEFNIFPQRLAVKADLLPLPFLPYLEVECHLMRMWRGCQEIFLRQACEWEN